MKNCKKIVLIGALLCCLVLLLSACGAQDPSELIVGDWVAICRSTSDGGHYHFQDGGELMTMKFDQNGALTRSDSSGETSWEIEGDRLTILDGGQTTEYVIIELDETILTIQTDDGQGGWIQLELARKR